MIVWVAVKEFNLSCYIGASSGVGGLGHRDTSGRRVWVSIGFGRNASGGLQSMDTPRRVSNAGPL